MIEVRAGEVDHIQNNQQFAHCPRSEPQKTNKSLSFENLKLVSEFGFQNFQQENSLFRPLFSRSLLDKSELSESIEKVVSSFSQEKYLVYSHPLEGHPKISSVIRSKVVDWIIDLTTLLPFKSEVAFISVNILDRCLERISNLDPSNLESIGLIAFFIASKFEKSETISIPMLSELNSTKNMRFEDYVQLEEDILKALEYKLCVPTALRFFLEFAPLFELSQEQTNLGWYLLETSLLIDEISRLRPSTIALITTKIVFQYTTVFQKNNQMKINDMIYSMDKNLAFGKSQDIIEQIERTIMFLAKQNASFCNSSQTSAPQSPARLKRIQSMDSPSSNSTSSSETTTRETKGLAKESPKQSRVFNKFAQAEYGRISYYLLSTQLGE